MNKYKLGKEVIYNSAASRRHLEKADRRDDGTALGSIKSLASVAMAILQLNISVNSLQRGQHIECKDLDEVRSAEEALQIACLNLRSYLDIAATFNGHENIYGFEDGKMLLLTTRTPALLPSVDATTAISSSPALIESFPSNPRRPCGLLNRGILRRSTSTKWC